MRSPRMTYTGAFHYVMNRGKKGETVFPDDDSKTKFLDLLTEISRQLKIRLFAYCLTDTHIHLVLENSGDGMSDFIRALIGRYGAFYRKRFGGEGSIFRDRYKSIAVQDGDYLKTAIAFTLHQPVREGTVKQFSRYPWTSFNHYFSGRESTLLDTGHVEGLFKNKNKLKTLVNKQSQNKKLPTLTTDYGRILGNVRYAKEAIEKYRQRKRTGETVQR
ncbi:MAG: hypothetical protein GY940_08825 [bacterium]|nr:hypothetical protein [bacterium]